MILKLHAAQDAVLWMMITLGTCALVFWIIMQAFRGWWRWREENSRRISRPTHIYRSQFPEDLK